MELIATYNYGGVTHFGKHRGGAGRLEDDPASEAYNSYACIVSIAGLSHLYFGFAVLLQAALAIVRRCLQSIRYRLIRVSVPTPAAPGRMTSPGAACEQVSTRRPRVDRRLRRRGQRTRW
ncbi:hypothetical protein ACQP1G_20510 [Nocardia sp. CA-107356]|uniref:hypothetical protein n=1 Tax=Nocardia sp. CA-107356 TaxID=3239972 RepID=UPI003D8F8D7D